MEVHFIINPVAKNGYSLKIWHMVENYLKQNDYSYHAHITKGPGDATEISSHILKNTKKTVYLIAVGGDGTVHEVINGAYSYPNGLIGYIPAGSGNDFSRGFQLPKKPKQALKHILNNLNMKPSIRLIDIGKFSDRDYAGYFVNNLGCGFDAKVAYEVNHSSLKNFFNRLNLGKLTYVYYLIKELFTYRPTDVTIEVDGSTHHFNKVWLVTVSNQAYLGGGMKLTPHAKTDDGELDVVIVHNLSRIKFLLLFIIIFWGKHIGLKEVSILKGKTFKIENSAPVYRHADGEYIGKGNIEVSVLPSAISITGNEVFQIPMKNDERNSKEFFV